jgi:soluble P-type ATPase
MRTKPGIIIPIPGFGERKIQILVTDYTGTLACGGTLAPGIRDRLLRLRDLVDVHVITADSFGTAETELAGIVGIVEPYKLREERHDIEKEKYAKQFEADHVAAFGNGNNDRLMLRAIKNGGGLAIAVDNGEGCALDAMSNSHIYIAGAANALDLLLDKTRCMATLRF